MIIIDYTLLRSAIVVIIYAYDVAVDDINYFETIGYVFGQKFRDSTQINVLFLATDREFTRSTLDADQLHRSN